MTPRACVLIFAALLATACAAESTAFRPVGPEAGVGPGYAAAFYDVQLPDTRANVKVWSDGAYRERSDQPDLVHIGLRVQNLGDAPLDVELRRTVLHLITNEGPILVRSPPRVSGGTEFAAGAPRRLELAYRLPTGLSRSEVTAFELTWVLRTGKDRVGRTTAFVRADDYEPTTVFVYDDWWWHPRHRTAYYRYYYRPIVVAPHPVRRR